MGPRARVLFASIIQPIGAKGKQGEAKVKTFRGQLDKGGQIETEAIKLAIAAFYRLNGTAPARVLVRPGLEAGTAATVKGLGRPAGEVEPGTRGILTGEIWME